MSGGIKFICFLLALPVLASIGYDGYMAYLDIEAGNPEPLKLTALGWLWETYAPASHNWSREIIGPDTWDSFIAPVLALKALFLTGGIALTFYAYLGIAFFLGIWPFNDKAGLFRDGKKSNADFAFDAEISDKKKQMKYKRK